MITIAKVLAIKKAGTQNPAYILSNQYTFTLPVQIAVNGGNRIYKIEKSCRIKSNPQTHHNCECVQNQPSQPLLPVGF